ncbi:MAG TPA: hypothetical protein DDX98_01295, partial [Bacteroidales bacterium]|nr:hypothetical protein [Bacteroidales bacterium]
NIQQVVFDDSKVIENELIKLVLVPEYGARILSFIYKPTNHEYLYQSECGSAYEIYNNIFYYDWLMVWGGIFPTFPEPEHGKTWLLPWKFSVIKNTADTVTIRMEHTDTTAYAGAPGGFNNGITSITCQIEVSVYSGSSAWDFDVKLINNQSQSVNYEYWTCTTLTPGSEMGNTGSPLNSEMVVPFDQYEAAWSPGGWIGNYGTLYNVDRIDFLSKWDDMGIAYAHNLNDNYWGVINHDNKEGIFRISENIETPGMKFWTWGKNNIDNDLYDFSNGGADNYIELWAGVSEAFFNDAVLTANEVKSWTETYGPTKNLTSITGINKQAAVNLLWDESNQTLSYELMAFKPNINYDIRIYLEGSSVYEVTNEEVLAATFGNSDNYPLAELDIEEGNYAAYFDLSKDGEQIFSAQKEIFVQASTHNKILEESIADNNFQIWVSHNREVTVKVDNIDIYYVRVVGLNGQLLKNYSFEGNESNFELPYSGVFIVNINGNNSVYTNKIIVK